MSTEGGSTSAATSPASIAGCGFGSFTSRATYNGRRCAPTAVPNKFFEGTGCTECGQPCHVCQDTLACEAIIDGWCTTGPIAESSSDWERRALRELLEVEHEDESWPSNAVLEQVVAEPGPFGHYVVRLPNCYVCRVIFNAFASRSMDAPDATRTWHRAVAVAENIVAAHLDHDWGDVNTYVGLELKLAQMSYSDFLWCRICACVAARDAWVDDILSCGDVEPNPGPGGIGLFAWAALFGVVAVVYNYDTILGIADGQCPHSVHVTLRELFLERGVDPSIVPMPLWKCRGLAKATGILVYFIVALCGAYGAEAFWRWSRIVTVLAVVFMARNYWEASSATVVPADYWRDIPDNIRADPAYSVLRMVFVYTGALEILFSPVYWMIDLCRHGDVEPNPGPHSCPVAPVVFLGQCPDVGPLPTAYAVRRSFICLNLAVLALALALRWLRLRTGERFWRTVFGYTCCPVSELGRNARWIPADGLTTCDMGECDRAGYMAPLSGRHPPERIYAGIWPVVAFLVVDTPIQGTCYVYRRASFCLWPWRGYEPVRLSDSDAFAPVRLPTSRRVDDIGPLQGAYLANWDGTDYAIIVSSRARGHGSKFAVALLKFLALTSNVYNNKTLDVMTTYHAQGHGDRERAVIERAGLWVKQPPLLLFMARDDYDHELIGAAAPRPSGPPREPPNSTTEALVHRPGEPPYAAIGNEPVRVESSNEDATKTMFKPRILCEPLDGVVWQGAHKDMSSKTAAVISRLEVPRPVDSELKWTPNHETIARRLGQAIFAAVGNVALTFAYYEAIAEHFTRPSQMRNLLNGTGPAFNVLVEEGIAFVKDEHLKSKANSAGKVVAGDQRNITSTPNIQAAGLLIVIELTRALSALGVTVTGLNIDDLHRRLEPLVGAPDDVSVVIAMDAERCDARVNRLTRLGGDTVIEQVWDPLTVPNALEISRKFHHMTGKMRAEGTTAYDGQARFDQLFSRASGAPDTYYGNTLDMTLIAATVADRWGLALDTLPSWFAASGDDSVWRYGPAHASAERARGLGREEAVALFASDIKECARFWGHVLDADRPFVGRGFGDYHRPAEFVPFLGRFFHDHPLTSFADPRRKIKSFGISYSNAPLEDVATGKGLGMCIDKHTYPWAYFTSAVHCLFAAGKNKGRSPGPIDMVIKPHMPYNVRFEALTPLPPPEHVIVHLGSRQLWEELCPGYDASPLVEHCKTWSRYESVSAFMAATPPFDVQPFTRDHDLARLNGVWLKEVDTLRASEVQAYLKMIRDERAALAKHQEEEDDASTDRSCWGCGETGHIRRDCPKAKQPPPATYADAVKGRGNKRAAEKKRDRIRAAARDSKRRGGSSGSRQ